MKKIYIITPLIVVLSVLFAITLTDNRGNHTYVGKSDTPSQNINNQSQPEAEKVSVIPEVEQKQTEITSPNTNQNPMPQPVETKYTYREVLKSAGATDELIACVEHLADIAMVESPTLDRDSYIIRKYNAVPQHQKMKLCGVTQQM